MTEVAAVLLAAGVSTRFGPENKLVAEFDGRPLVRAVADAILNSEIAEVVVVTGADAAPIERALEGLPVCFVHNARWQNGMGSSIAAGVSALGDTADAAFIVPGDMPLLTAGLLRRLIAAFERHNGAPIVYPATADGAQRNPVLWPRRQFPLLTALGGRGGAKTLLQRFASSCTAVKVPDDKVLADVDTVDDLAAARDQRRNLLGGAARLGNGREG